MGPNTDGAELPEGERTSFFYFSGSVLFPGRGQALVLIVPRSWMLSRFPMAFAIPLQRPELSCPERTVENEEDCTNEISCETTQKHLRCLYSSSSMLEVCGGLLVGRERSAPIHPVAKSVSSACQLSFFFII